MFAKWQQQVANREEYYFGNKLPKIRNIYVISLEESRDRQTYIKTLMQKYNIEFTLCIMNRPSRETYEEYLATGGTMSRGQLGCLISQSIVLKKVTEGRCLIFEDDIIPPIEYDPSYCPFSDESPIWMYGCSDKYTSERTSPVYKHTKNDDSLWGMFAYAPTKEAANEMFSILEKFECPCDWHFEAIAQTGDLEIAWPPIFIPDRSSSNTAIDTEETEINYPDLDLSKYQNVNICNIRPYIVNSDKVEELITLGHLSANLFIKNYGESPKKETDAIDRFRFLSDKFPYPENNVDNMAVCIAFFSPVKYRQPVINLKAMISLLNEHKVKPYLIELYNDTPVFQESESFHYFNVHSNSMMFHKENLWNIVEKKLPDYITKLLFLDGDVIFDNSDWFANIRDNLDIYDVFQPFSLVELRSSTVECLQKYSSACSKKFNYPENVFGSPGYGVACRRDWFQKIGGFFEYSIGGGGDMLFWNAVLQNTCVGVKAYEYQHYLHEDYSNYYKSLQNTRYGYVQGKIYHMFHGYPSDRNYTERYLPISVLRMQDFKKNDAGVIEFKNPERWNLVMKDFFEGRSEDIEIHDPLSKYVKPEYKIYSLGYWSYVASILGRNGYKNGQYPFDSVESGSSNDVANLLKSDMSILSDVEMIRNCGEFVYATRKYVKVADIRYPSIIFNHHFDSWESVLDDQIRNRVRKDFLIKMKRLKNELEEGYPTILLRVNLESSKNLIDAVNQFAPNNNAIIMYCNVDGSQIREYPGVYHVNLPDAQWQEKLPERNPVIWKKNIVETYERIYQTIHHDKPKMYSVGDRVFLTKILSDVAEKSPFDIAIAISSRDIISTLEEPPRDILLDKSRLIVEEQKWGFCAVMDTKYPGLVFKVCFQTEEEADNDSYRTHINQEFNECLDNLIRDIQEEPCRIVRIGEESLDNLRYFLDRKFPGNRCKIVHIGKLNTGDLSYDLMYSYSVSDVPKYKHMWYPVIDF